MNPAEKVLFAVDGGVATLILNRPDAMNSYDVELVDALLARLADVSADPQIRAVVLTGAGSVFCAGADVRMMAGSVGQAQVPESARRFVERLHTALHTLHVLPLPVICAVNGACAGGAVGMALAGDITWAAASASFTTAFTGIGLSPDTGTSYFLPRAVGPRVARELLLTNRRVKAPEALSLGLVTRVLPDGDLLPAAQTLAARLAAGPTAAFARAKALLDQSSQSSLADQLDREHQNVMASLTSHDLAEGVRAFVARRPPVFSGR